MYWYRIRSGDSTETPPNALLSSSSSFFLLFSNALPHDWYPALKPTLLNTPLSNICSNPYRSALGCILARWVFSVHVTRGCMGYLYPGIIRIIIFLDLVLLSLDWDHSF